MELYEVAILGGFLLVALWILYKQHFSKDRDCGCGSGSGCKSRKDR
ncbi:MAG: hypothetical protein ACTTH5_06355 [Wolinella sp.]